MKGRPRTPTHLKLVRGTDRADRGSENEPTPRRERPSPPAHLSDRGKMAWAEATAIVDGMGVLTAADPVALEMLAEALADIRTARASLARPLMLSVEGDGEREVAKAGERYYWTFGKGGPMRRQRPEIADIADADRRLMGWVAKFGMSPADRSRVSAAPQEDVNPFAALA